MNPSQFITLRYPLCILLDILRGRPDGLVGRSEVALVEHAQLVGRECADDGVQNAAVMEEHEVVLLPVVRVDELLIASVS